MYKLENSNFASIKIVTIFFLNFPTIQYIKSLIDHLVDLKMLCLTQLSHYYIYLIEVSKNSNICACVLTCRGTCAHVYKHTE